MEVRSPSLSPECWVVRIYRRRRGGTHLLVGTAEQVGQGSETSFRNLRELRRILLLRQAAP